MKRGRICSALIATTFLFLQGCESKEDHVFQIVRCGAAGAIDGYSDPSLATRTGQAIAQYKQEHGLKMSFAELTVLTDKAQKEIMGVPGSPLQDWVDRAKKITESEFCKKNFG
ncbi:hypothetical protein C1Y08_28655 [Pseudomonas sp. FW306-02-F02-AA]|uniref:Lipoprotein n=1 Tax=Pseudomonas fluorescens TaxID=294 RepID=A0A0N9WMH4_PSEFL|nr:MULTISPECIES: hypothetical protein [Pseudomonas]ALI04559.1 hypothetical protein AO353_27185 [Pseudomonas fluorescens]PMZ02376.1 hypothetical protein C1Y07_20600 [Pseudomonas sp. FW306-02-F02-AB]PMZ06590.1 hypothetical protein C1Y06_28900 [Pseudomonas sp. FW306-02-H06C]PMZ12542.1 hypothetical protein C1Y08_28655 [Pseudomonas sp. FW306-02-F02-AA]PMZ18544.1 hypothetical protein C1Y09_28855 [Pseudomonas sp. FW306-02-F08-AA]